MTNPRPIPEALLEKYLADALDGAARADVERRLAGSPEDRRRLEALRASSAAFLLQNPPGRFAARVTTQRRARWWAWGMPAIALASLLVLVLVRPSLVNAPEVEPEWSVKGQLAMAVYVKQGTGAKKLLPGEKVEAGAQLRFEVAAEKKGFVALLGRDGTGAVSVYVPEQGAQAVPYSPTSPLLDLAIELDASPGPERFYALYSLTPFDVKWADEALKRGTPLQEAADKSAPGVAITQVEVQKAL